MTADTVQAPVPSVLADLGRVPLGKLPGDGVALAGTLNRVLPAPEAQAVPVAAFNSGI